MANHSPQTLRSQLVDSIASLETHTRKLRAQGNIKGARNLEATTATSRRALSILDAELAVRKRAVQLAVPTPQPVAHPQLAAMNRLVARATGNDRRTTKVIAGHQFVGVPADYNPFA
jgi:hypothetical protein